ncbi:hypothetical protein FDECE_6386 [Fusarium decemcellulare]|nr:hypothetical protein FDECE_6386 [Fusarium decemcellulare]
MKQLHIGLDKLRMGIPWGKIEKWSELEALGSAWADPPELIKDRRISYPTSTSKETKKQTTGKSGQLNASHDGTAANDLENVCMICHVGESGHNHTENQKKHGQNSANILTCPCGHKYCYSCLQKLFRAAITDEGLFPPRCYGEIIQTKDVEHRIPSALFRTCSKRKPVYVARDSVMRAAPPWETYRCSPWQERGLFDRGTAIVERKPNSPAEGSKRNYLVKASMNRLKKNVLFGHESWRILPGVFKCEECSWNSPRVGSRRLRTTKVTRKQDSSGSRQVHPVHEEQVIVPGGKAVLLVCVAVVVYALALCAGNEQREASETPYGPVEPGNTGPRESPARAKHNFTN